MGIQITQNFSSQIEAINNAVPSAMNRTFYVDAVNGNDANDGSQANPFKTIKKAIESVPVGGVGLIKLFNSQTHIIDTPISFSHKLIQIVSKDGTSTPGSPDDNTPIIKFADDGTTVLGGIIYSGVLVFGDWSWPVVVEVGDGSALLAPYSVSGGVISGHKAIIMYGGEGYLNGALSIIHSEVRTSANFVANIPHVSLRGSTIKVLQGNTFVSAWDGVLIFRKSGGSIVDGNGNDITTTCISNIIRDANGVPRNIVSNIIF